MSTAVAALALGGVALFLALGPRLDASSGAIGRPADPAGSPAQAIASPAQAIASPAQAMESTAVGSSPSATGDEASPGPTASPPAPASPEASIGPSASTGPSPAIGAGAPAPTLSPPPSPGPFSMDLYRPGDFAHEAKPYMCVPAAMQTMIDIMSGTPDDTVATQQRLYALARKLSPKTLKGPGAEPEGWARSLGQLGFGTFAVSVRGSVTNAIHAAARAIRLTGRPAGLLVWYGAHSWVMSGFKATADPAFTTTFTVTAVYIEDVWYPSWSSIWGYSRPPDALVPVDRLPRDFLPWRMPGGPYPDKAWKFVTVVPVIPPAAGG